MNIGPIPCLTLSALLAPALTAQVGISNANTATTTTAQYIAVPYHKSLVPQTGITVEAWITYDESTLGSSWRWPTICRLNPNGGQEAYWFRVQAGTNASRVLALGITTSVGLTTVGYSFAAGELLQWTHVAATFDGTAQRIYINGILKSTTTNTLGPNLRDQGGEMRIGNGDGNPIENWNGEIDEVRVWPFARSAEEIQSTMNLELNSVPGLVSTWNLNFTPDDSSGNNNGANVGTVSYGVNTNTLSGGAIGATTFGAGLSGCGNTPIVGVSGLATAGNTGFGLTCLNAAKGTGSVGFVWVGVGRLNSSILLSGAPLWVDPSAGGLLVPMLGDSNGLIKIAAPIPAGTPVGTDVFAQYFFNQSGCAVPLFSSEGLAIKTL